MAPHHAHNDPREGAPWPDDAAPPVRVLSLTDEALAELRRQAHDAVQAAFVLGLVVGGGLVLLGVLLRGWWGS